MNRLLSVLSIVVLLSATLVFVTSYLEFSNTNYKSNIKYDLSKGSQSFDYSCNEKVYSLFLVLKNTGSKLVQDLSISVTHGICKGAVPPIPSSLAPVQKISLYVYTYSPNGTITVSGNNTLVSIKF